MRYLFISFFAFLLLGSCQNTEKVDLLIVNAQILDGSGGPAFKGAVGIINDTIAWIGADPKQIKAVETIDAEGKIVSPGFIDSHTHSLRDLQSPKRKANVNYLVQGVTTVMNGNDGGGPVKIRPTLEALDSAGIGTNVALFVGHGTVRKLTMAMDQRDPEPAELEQMKSLVRIAMEQGALGFSSGLFYAPASFAKTEEVVELAKVAAEFGALYDVHMRDESSYNIGLLASIDETIEIARKANIPANIAHIKALGVDVWGKSEDVIKKINAARAEGLLITADQYPFEASSTSISAALVPKWVFADIDDYTKKFDDPALLPKIKEGIKENLRRRGGAEAILLTAAADSSLSGSTLQAIADIRQITPVDAVIEVCKLGGSAVASFNMQESDIQAFMGQDWVMTSSDGGSPHPRKYASFSKKIKKYVLEENILALEQMVHQSSGMTAEVFGVPNRGFIREGYYADLIIFDPEDIQYFSTFAEPAQLSTGMTYVIVNGQVAIKEGKFQDVLAGRAIYRQED